MANTEKKIFESLKGKYKHYCQDWDFLAIDETCPEFQSCLCFKKEKEMNNQDHVNHLKYEVETLKSMVQEYDTGHIKTAIQVLEARIKDIIQEELPVLDSSYPDGDGYWK
jgi:hypothetical protein